jgi:Fe2+-dicitrate sensor, membrane component
MVNNCIEKTIYGTDKTQKDYSKFSLSDFLKDDDFIRWRLLRTDDLTEKWESTMIAYPKKKEEIKNAIEILDNMKFDSNFDLTDIEENILFDSILKKYSKRKIKLRRILYSTSVAAVLLIGLLVTFIHKTKHPEFDYLSNNEIIKNLPYLYTTIDQTCLYINSERYILPDSTSMQIDRHNNSIYLKKRSKVFYSINYKNSDLACHIAVPNGKKTDVLLSDGTEVFINSGSIIGIPLNESNKYRMINVEGEVYMDVEKDKERPFYISSSDFTVKVYGTKLNITSYKDEPYKSVVLIEGKISVNKFDQEIFLSNNQMFRVRESEYNILNVDGSDYASWKDNMLVFNSEEFSNIIARLSRHYNAQFEISDSVKDRLCTGKLVLF